MERKTPFAPDEYYHIYNRGTDKREIFLGPRDYDRFSQLLYLCNGQKPVSVREASKGRSFECDRGDTIVNIGAYCLMPNHFHLLIKEKEEGGISTFMKKLATGYSMYFNIKNERSGSLFQGRFKSKHIEEDEYLKYLFAYIHLNPVKIVEPIWKDKGVNDKNKVKQFLSQYHYSSYLDYLDRGKNRDQTPILARDVFPDYFEGGNSFESYIKDFFDFNKEAEDRKI